jgi:hypothetical protein
VKLPFLLVVAVALVAACKAPTTARPDAGQQQQQRPARPVIDDTSFRYPAVERIVAIGDLHGDLRATRAALALAGALSADDHWAGGKLVVVQTGDQLDRGDDEPEILDLLERLSTEAAAAGGALHVLNGNHEVMNVQGDFRYVTEDGFHDYQDASVDGPHLHKVEKLPPQARGRASVFLPGAPVAKRLAKRQSIIQVGDSVFVHGGLHERHVRRGIAKINRSIQEWMIQGGSSPAPAVAMEQDGPLWSRAYSDGVPSPAACKELATVLDWLSAKRLVVGHSVQQQGVNSACDGKVWRIDVGLSRYYGNPTSVLEIRGAETRVLAGG